MKLSLIAIVGAVCPAHCNLPDCITTKILYALLGNKKYTICVESFMERRPPSYRQEGNAKLYIEEIYFEDMGWTGSGSCSVMTVMNIVFKTVGNCSIICIPKIINFFLDIIHRHNFFI
jgi:hypothetical protein